MTRSFIVDESSPLSMRYLILGALVLPLLLSPGEGYYFEDGYQHHYTYVSTSHVLNTKDLRMNIKFHVQCHNRSADGSSLNLLYLDSFVQIAGTHQKSNPLNWDYKRSFLFHMTADGLIQYVHYDITDHDEAVMLKKILASTLSAKSRQTVTGPRNFVINETDHSGHMEHRYEVRRDKNGLHVRRSHESTKEVYRKHHKELFLSHGGTIQTIKCMDTVELKDQSPPQPQIKPQREEEELKLTPEDQIPVITTKSSVNIKLQSKRKMSLDETQEGVKEESLHEDTIEIGIPKKAKERRTEKSQEKHIKELLECIASYENKTNPNRTQCVSELSEELGNMDDKRYRSHVQHELNKTCIPTNKACENRRLLFLDLVAYKGDNFSQEFLARHFLKNPEANETDIERILVLIVRLQHPTMELLEAVETLCLGKQKNIQGVTAMTKIQRKSCLSLGALVKTQHFPEKMDGIVTELEKWLQKHDPVEAERIIKPRKKRSVKEFDKRRHYYIQTKLVLIHALGNAARGRSVPLITSYMDPHNGHNDWKHAAIHGLRFYSCNESADALVRSFAADRDDLVREMAYNIFKKHPLAGDGNNQRHKDIIRSLRYTYQHLVRLKRSIITAEFRDGGIYFSIRLPGIEWNKRVGLSAIGAGFGLTIRNGMEVDVKPLQGYAEVDVYDEAYVKVFLGWFGLEFSIIHAFYCYQGHIRYDLNILKDFGINDIQDLANIFDKVFDTIVRPIETAITAFKAIIEQFKGGLQNIVNEIVNLLRDLPVILNTLIEDVAEAVLKALKYKAYPWINQIQKIALKARFFIEDVKADVLGFYNTIADAITVTLPYGAKKIYDAIAGINNGFKNFFKNPVQAIFGVGRAILDIRFAVGIFFDVKNRVVDAISMVTGKSPFWLNYDDDLSEILHDITDLIDMVTDPSSVSSTSSNITSLFSDGIKAVDDHTSEIKNALNKAFGTFTSLITSTLDRLGKPFFDAFRSVMEAVRGIKLSFENLRDMVIKAKSLVEKIFGPKFHVKFPSRRRYEVSGCGQGVWPTTTNGKYSTEGVDVVAKYGEKIVCPVNGIVKSVGGSRVIIQPKDDDFLDLEIVIDNIIPSSEVDGGGKYLRAGEDHIGTADSSPCKPNFIHVAVRQTSEDQDTLPDNEYEYVDPSKYLDRLIPYPKWMETCNDNFIKIFGIVVDADILAAAAQGWDALIKRVAEKVQETVQEKFEDIGNEMEGKVYDIVLSTGQKPNVGITPLHKLDGNPEVYRPPGMDLVDYNNPKSHQAWADFKNGLKNVLGQFKNIAKQLFDFSPNRTGVNILDVVDVNKYTVAQIRDIVDQTLSAELDLIYAKYRDIQAAVPTGHLQGLSLAKMRQLLSISFDRVSGSQSHMISRILGMAENECPLFTGHITKGQGHLCFAHPDCQGLTCGINIAYGGFNEMVQVEIRVDPCTYSLNVSSPNHDTVIVQLSSGDFSFQINLSDKSVDGLAISLSVEGYTDATSSIVFSVSAEICALAFESCLPGTDLITDMELETGTNCDQAQSKYSISNLETLTLQELINVLAEFNLLNKDVLDVIDTLREAVLKELLDDPRTILKVLGVEFKNKLDFCKDVGKPFPPYDFPLFFSFFVVFAGPIPVIFKFGASAAAGLDMRFGICFLSFKCQTTVTPWAGAKVYGGAHVWLVVFEAGVVLTGHIMDTRFPIYGAVQFNKFPIDVLATMDLYMVPLRVVLSAYCRFVFRICFWKCFTIRITLFNGIIWQFATPAIRARILTIGNEGQDMSPPTFDDNGKKVSSSARKRSVSSGCELYQIPGRNPSDTAFKLRATVSDDITEAKLYFAIGTSQGATNVMGWTDMGGSLLVYAVNLPNSIPLYWTLKAVNNQGLETYTNCMLNTYDNTVPDGRVDPSYIYSSHPHTLSGTVIAFDDSPLLNTHLVALGYSPGAYGNEVVGWQTFSLSDSSVRQHIQTDLKHFSEPKPGKLTSAPFATLVKERPSDCATECVLYSSKCVSFDYDYFTESCDLQAFVEGPAAKLRKSGHYVNYERLGIGQNAFIEFNNLPLEHGNVYFFNAIINNTLNYTGVMHSVGTMVDFTPPEPGVLGRFYKEMYRADGCRASYDQNGRCINVTPLENHRIIEDGNESSTVFNGHRPLEDMQYTRSNHYASVNFDGFRDNETGIYRYMWAVGHGVCGYDTVDFQDPHEFLHSSKHWTNSGYQKNLTLKDGWYYVTVQALNNIIHGGALVTTLCHTTPFAVDTTPPNFHGVDEIYFDEDFDLLGVYYKADDPLSGLYSVDFGLGKTKYDVLVRRYSYHAPMDRKNPYVVVEELGLEDGVPSWIRIRPMNRVRLFTAGHGDEPILIDRTPPIAGNVLDGDIVLHDVTYQADNSQICAHWNSFYDPESGVEQFRWGVGTTPGLDDIISFHNYTHNIRFACVNARLLHNTTYFSTVIVFNGALNTKDSNSSSNGVLIDITPPEAGNVNDGDLRGLDMTYSSETATKSCYWENFTDPESGITKYDVTLSINNEPVKTFNVGLNIDLLDHSVTLNHEDEVKFTVTATNGARSSTAVSSNGFKVDHTPPEMVLLSDTNSNSRYQTSTDTLTLQWQFRDRESGIKEYRYFIFEDKHGSKTRFWPVLESYEIIVPSIQGEIENEILQPISLTNGGKYSLHVTAINKAGLSTAHESEGIMVDSTPPIMTMVHIGLSDEEEEINENGQVEHPDPDGITVSWNAFDQESGISSFHLAIGTSPGDNSVTEHYYDVLNGRTSYVKVSLETYSDSNKVYYVSVKAINGAGLFSHAMVSSPVIVLKENIPGVIFDGRMKYEDVQKTHDTSSISLSFTGFESEACNIIGYEFAIGSRPYFSDISPFGEFGIVHNGTHGHAERNVDLRENETYFSTVRARTGHNCHEDFIVSSSNGITTDAIEPKVLEILPINQDHHYTRYGDIFYQNDLDTLDVIWNITDQSNDVSVNYSVGHLPFLTDIFPSTMSIDGRTNPGLIHLKEGETVFVNVRAEDVVGNSVSVTSPQITADITKPKAVNFTCTDIISEKHPEIKCEWISRELQSSLLAIVFSVGSSAKSADLISEMKIPTSSSAWKADLRNIDDALRSTSLYINMKMLNVLDIEELYVRQVMVDHTPPTVSAVEIVTWTSTSDPITKKICQIPWTYADIKINNAEDPESSISRSMVCLGRSPRQCDVRSFRDVQDFSAVQFSDLSLSPGERIFATAIIFNRVGLSTLATSDGSVVSPNPILSVIDGIGPMDRDFQSDLNVIQGVWEYSEPCPIVQAEWAIHDLKGNLIQEYIGAAGNGHILYNDELELENNMMYMISVRITDAINRTAEGQSDGIVILIQPPGPGDIRDGLGDQDIDYQESITQLSANWENFGSSESTNPTQMIDYYEVAIGDDRREHTTRVNIHYFVNVGLNTSVTLTNLNLTAKTVTYYITVRAHSMTGAYEEAYTNGIRVGYREGVFPGEVEYDPFQHNIDSISVSWRSFEADIGIDKFIIGVSTLAVIEHNETFNCHLIERNLTSLFDVVVPNEVGEDTVHTFVNLTLQHGESYYVTVFAADIIGMCGAATGGPILVDKTPPDSSSLSIRLNQRDVVGKESVFVDDERQAKIEFLNVMDSESGILETTFQLVKFKSCPEGNGSGNNRILMQEIKAENETKMSFFDVGLRTDEFYKILATTENHAGLKTNLETPVFKLDKTGPLAGSVKIGTDFYTSIDFQSSVHDIIAYTALARTQEAYECPNSKQLFPTNTEKLTSLGDKYTPANVEEKLSNILLHIGYDIPLTKVLKSGVRSPKQTLIKGIYSINLVSASGRNIVTTFSLSTLENYFPKTFVAPVHNTVKESDFENAENSSSVDINNISQNGTSVNTTTTTVATTTTATISANGSDSDHLKAASEIGFGIHILGSRQNNSDEWDILIWAADRYKTDEQWITIKADPTSSINTYSFDFVENKAVTYTSWDITVNVNGQSKAKIDGFRFPSDMYLYIQTWNKDGYEEPITDPFKPYRSKVDITKMSVPLGRDKPCLHGKGFYDKESGISELWVGVSDNVNDMDNIKKFSLYESICIQCIGNCTIGCVPSCTQNEDFEIKKIRVDNLDLLPTIANNDGSNATVLTEIRNSSTYYVNVKSVNLAGQTVSARSNPVMIDNTPPQCQQMVCTDPVNTGLDEPTDYLGSNKTVGAYWRCEEDVTEISSYIVSVGIDSSDDSLFKETNVGLITKSRINLGESKTFEHGSTYFVNLKVQNSAGLSSNYSCSTKVLLLAPNVSETQSETLYTDSSQTALTDVSVVHQQDRVGILWRSPFDDAEFYEFQVGSGSGSSDLIPRITIGVLQEGSVAVINGQLWLNGNNTNKSVSAFTSRNIRNVSESDNADTVQDYSFLSEPGRCLYPKLYAVGYSHLSAEIPSKPVCIARSTDTQQEFNGRKIYDIPLSSAQNPGQVSLSILGDDGGIITGMLSTADLEAQYGSASSAGFISYISDPVTTVDFTDRFLRRRLVQSMGVSFFVSPAPSASFEMITVSIHIGTLQFENDTVPALVVWNYHDTTDNPYGTSGVWNLVSESCGGDPLNPRIENGVYVVEVCPQALDITTIARSKRTTSGIITTPTQLSLMAMNISYYNVPPVIDTDAIYLAEDTRADEQLLWHDDDFDGVSFGLGSPPNNGTANITEDGVLTYIPDSNFAGTDFVEVIIFENSTINPATVSKYIELVVSDVNDPPFSGYTYNDTSYETLLNNTVEILFEANTTHRSLLHFYLGDIDYNETLTVLSSASNIDNVSFSLTEDSDDTVPLDLFQNEPIKLLRKFKVDMVVDKQFNGDFSYFLLGYDKSKFYSERLEAHVYILKHPCVYGECEPKNNYSESCNDVMRATTFDPFVCSCYPGYKGEWCETEIDECFGNPCGIMNYCIDRINYYQCRPHPGKWVAVVFGILAFIVTLYLMYIFMRKKCGWNSTVAVQYSRNDYERKFREDQNYDYGDIDVFRMEDIDNIPIMASKNQPSFPPLYTGLAGPRCDTKQSDRKPILSREDTSISARDITITEEKIPYQNLMRQEFIANTRPVFDKSFLPAKQQFTTDNHSDSFTNRRSEENNHDESNDDFDVFAEQRIKDVNYSHTMGVIDDLCTRNDMFDSDDCDDNDDDDDDDDDDLVVQETRVNGLSYGNLPNKVVEPSNKIEIEGQPNEIPENKMHGSSKGYLSNGTRETTKRNQRKKGKRHKKFEVSLPPLRTTTFNMAQIGKTENPSMKVSLRNEQGRKQTGGISKGADHETLSTYYNRTFIGNNGEAQPRNESVEVTVGGRPTSAGSTKGFRTLTPLGGDTIKDEDFNSNIDV